MDTDTRNAIEHATQRARKILEDDFAAQLEGDFDVHGSGIVAREAGAHLPAHEVFRREKIVAAIDHKRAAGMGAQEAVADYIRDAAFTTLNRFVALKMLEARGLLQECVTNGEQSSGYREFYGLAPGVSLLPESAGYRLYIESLFDELSTEVKVLFDRCDPASVLWPKRLAFEQLLDILNSADLTDVWTHDETIGWVYQYFNSKEERAAMRDTKQGGSQAPRNSRELAIRNQFFTPRYVVQFLTDNTLGRIWYEMRDGKTALAQRCEYMACETGEGFAPRQKKDPRDLRILDPACGSGHFLLYAFSLLLTIYEEAYADPECPKSEATGAALAADYPSIEMLRRAVPGLILAHNLHGVDIDPRCAQIAQLGLWMRAQRAYDELGVDRAQRQQIRRSNIVVAEPLVADDRQVVDFVARLGDAELGRVFVGLVDGLKLAGDLGLLLPIGSLVAGQPKQGYAADLFTPPGERIRAALARFVAEDVAQASTQWRLFAEDMAQALGLLAVAGKAYDVILMNPPFGEASPSVEGILKSRYPASHHDLSTCFVEAGCSYLHPDGLLGAITTRTVFLLPQSVQFRSSVLKSGRRVRVAADLGYGVLDGATVETAAYIVSVAPISKGTWIRLVNEPNKAKLLMERPAELTYRIPAELFSKLPNTSFSYWIPNGVLTLLNRFKPFEDDNRCVRCGMGTLDDFRFVRCWWEVSPTRLHVEADRVDVRQPWVAYAKGGEASPFVIDMPLVVNFGQNGNELKAFVGARVGSPSRKIQAERFYFRSGIQFGRRVRRLSPAVLPRQAIFSDSANAVFVEHDDEDLLFAYLALLNGDTTRAIFSVFAPARKMEVGFLQRMPVPVLTPSDVALVKLGRAGATEALHRVSASENSRHFVVPRPIQTRAPGFDAALNEATRIRYSLDAADVQALEATSETQLSVFTSEEELETEASAEANLMKISWLVGIALGRFDPRLATGARPIPARPGPFDPLPARSSGMWPDNEASPLTASDIMVDDPGHLGDIRARVASAAASADLVDPGDLGQWIATEFFPLHIRMYSKSGRKAPIYWQLATASASYSVWLYIHVFTKDTLFRVQNDYVSPKLAHEERKLEEMGRELRDKATAAERKVLAVQEMFVEELRTFLDEVKRVAPLWKPNLDDGVIINFAPLWRLVPQHKPWQKEVKSTWDALCDGKYDWAHLAMHLWPERVVPKCAADRSLAIAHGLEEVFWVQGADGRWKKREIPTSSVIELVLERTSSAVKAALASLLEAPAMNGGSRARGGRRRAADTDVRGSH